MQNNDPGFTATAITPLAAPLLLANTNSNGTGQLLTGSVTMYKIATAGADGALLDVVRFFLTATTAGTSSTPTMARIYISSITTGATTSADTIPIAEVALPATVGDSATVAQNVIDVPLGVRIPAGWTILISIHAVPAANTAWLAIPFGGNF